MYTGKCGGFSTRTCDDEPASGGGAPGGVATPEVEVEAPPAAAAAETPGRCIPAAVHPVRSPARQRILIIIILLVQINVRTVNLLRTFRAHRVRVLPYKTY